MIIQRISKGIKEQDWFVVSVEVMIVVVGIFIGLQVDDWNEARKRAVLEEQARIQLVQDIDLAIENAQKEIGDTARIIEGALFVLEVLDGVEVTEENEGAFSIGLHRIWQSTKPELGVGSIGTLLSGQPLPLAPKYKVPLSRMTSSLAANLQVINHVETLMDMHSEVIFKYYSSSTNIPEYPNFNYNLDTMRNSDEFRYAFQSMVSKQKVRQRWTEITLSVLEDFKSQIDGNK